jgi:hypothetical protein
MKHLRLDLYGINEHPQAFMRRVGIAYQYATPQSMGDCWWFWNCENAPDELPPALEVLNLAPHKAIGWGLSKEQADSIVEYADRAAHAASHDTQGEKNV